MQGHENEIIGAEYCRTLKFNGVNKQTFKLDL